MILTAEEIRQKQIERIKDENKNSLAFSKIMEKIMERIQEKGNLDRDYVEIELKELYKLGAKTPAPFYHELIKLGYKVEFTEDYFTEERCYRIEW